MQTDVITESIALMLNDLVKEAKAALDTFTPDAIQGDPDAKTERAWWNSQYNAFKNAQADFLVCHARATWVGDAYSVPSSRTGHAPHRIERMGHVWVCDCEASTNGRFCRHLALVDATERAAEGRADAADILADAEDARAEMGETRPVAWDDESAYGISPNGVLVRVDLISRIADARAKVMREMADLFAA